MVIHQNGSQFCRFKFKLFKSSILVGLTCCFCSTAFLVYMSGLIMVNPIFLGSNHSFFWVEPPFVCQIAQLSQRRPSLVTAIRTRTTSWPCQAAVKHDIRTKNVVRYPQSTDIDMIYPKNIYIYMYKSR